MLLYKQNKLYKEPVRQENIPSSRTVRHTQCIDKSNAKYLCFVPTTQPAVPEFRYISTSMVCTPESKREPELLHV